MNVAILTTPLESQPEVNCTLKRQSLLEDDYCGNTITMPRQLSSRKEFSFKHNNHLKIVAMQRQLLCQDNFPKIFVMKL